MHICELNGGLCALSSAYYMSYICVCMSYNTNTWVHSIPIYPIRKIVTIRIPIFKSKAYNIRVLFIGYFGKPKLIIAHQI